MYLCYMVTQFFKLFFVTVFHHTTNKYRNNEKNIALSIFAELYVSNFIFSGQQSVLLHSGSVSPFCPGHFAFIIGPGSTVEAVIGHNYKICYPVIPCCNTYKEISNTAKKPINNFFSLLCSNELAEKAMGDSIKVRSPGSMQLIQRCFTILSVNSM